jgi:twitching motility protein PilT
VSFIEPLMDALEKSGAEEMHLEPDQPIYILRDGQRQNLGREGVQQNTLERLVAEVLGAADGSVASSPKSIARGGKTFSIASERLNGTLKIRIRRVGSSMETSTPGAAREAKSAPSTAETKPRPQEVEPAKTQPPVSAASTTKIEKILRLMIDEDASDLHVCSGAAPVMRVHGEIRFLEDWGVMSSDEIEGLIRPVMPEDVRQRFEETRDADCAYEIEGVSRFRVNVFEDRKGVGFVIRRIPFEIIPADQLGLPKAVLELCYLSKGLVVVTGPTGSGKSTTLAAMVDYINRNRTDHIITIEDPVEFVHENKKCLINQREVGRNTRSFKNALRAALREDPDVVLVGEMRDLETIAIAIETAETGHLVFGTLHTTTAGSTVDRIIDQFPADRQEQIRIMLSETLKGVIAQILCKKVGGGRVAALEILLGTPAVASLIREGKTFQIPSIMQTSRGMGMLTMNDSLFRLVQEKVVEPKEAWLKAVDKAGLENQLRGAGFPADFAGGT